MNATDILPKDIIRLDGFNTSINDNLFHIMASELNGSELKLMISIIPKMVDGEYHNIKNTYISETTGITYSVVGRSLSGLVNKGYLIRENSNSRRYRFDLDTMADKVNNWVIVDEENC